MVHRLLARIRNLIRRSQAAAELEEELDFHIEQETAANVARGMSASEARRATLAALGGVVQTKEAVRDIRSLRVDAIWQDARHAVRALIAAPSFSGVVLVVVMLS